MTLKQISELINNTLVKNELGESVQIAEDLSNIIDFGTAIKDLTADQLKDYTNSFVVGCSKTYFDTREYKRADLGLFADSVEYGGIIQSVKSKMLETVDNQILQLETGTDYMDGKYYGLATDVKVYEKDTAWSVRYSIPVTAFKNAFNSVEGVRGLVGLIETMVRNTLNRDIHILAKRCLTALAVDALKNNRKVELISEYKAFTGATGATNEEVLSDRGFYMFVRACIGKLSQYMTDYGHKYSGHDTVSEKWETFTPISDVKITLLSDFSQTMENMVNTVRNADKYQLPEHNQITCWQNISNEILPAYDSAISTIIDGTGEPVTYNNVIGIVYDRLGAGITMRNEKVTSQYVGAGDFTTYYHNYSARYFVDDRCNCVALVLS